MSRSSKHSPGGPYGDQLPDVEQLCKDRVDLNWQLLSILEQTDYAVSTPNSSKRSLLNLKSDLTAIEKELEKLHGTTEAERKAQTEHPSTFFGNLRLRLSRNEMRESWEAKAEEIGRRFQDAWQKEYDTAQRRDELRSTVSSTMADISRNKQAQAELDQLYASIFDGPTPQFLTEDRREDAFRNARAKRNDSVQALREQKEALSLSKGCHLSLQRAFDLTMRATLCEVRTQCVPPSWWQAKQAYLDARRHMVRARSEQPQINKLGGEVLTWEELACDVAQGVFPTLAEHPGLEFAKAQLQQALGETDEQLNGQEQRVRHAEKQLEDDERKVEVERSLLQRFRSEAFETLAGCRRPCARQSKHLQVTDEAPPVYTRGLHREVFSDADGREVGSECSQQGL